MDEIVQALNECNQNHIVELIPDLLETADTGVKHPIYQQLTKINIANSCNYFRNAAAHQEISNIDYSPLFNVVDLKENTSLQPFEVVGQRFLKLGKVAAVILSGGQGTRLGFPGPKGMFDKLGLISGKTVFQIHIEKIMKIKRLSADKDHLARIPIYIMTSDLNHNIIVEFFKSSNFFGYPSEDVLFFEQGLEPCFSNDGKIIIESPSNLSMAPDGNGGIYNALKKSGYIDDMVERGVEFLHIYGIDNVLTKPLDPIFLGICIDKGVECGNKVVWRANAAEKVGVTVMNQDKMYIIEYSEIPPAMRDAVDASGKLLFGAANICNHFLSVDFIIKKVLPNLGSTYHSASKKIPYMDPVSRETIQPTHNNGVKLEMFIFDVFPLAEKWVVVEAARSEEFSPVKNEPGNAQDSPDTALQAISAQGKRWLEAAGAVVRGEGVCEISPLVSYGGEGLEKYKGVVLDTPICIEN